MTTALEAPAPLAAPFARPPDHRGSPIPNLGMIATRFMELRKRRGLMIALIVVNIGIPSIFLVVRLLAHAFAPKSYGPAGGYDIFTNLVAGVMFIFGFIVAATLGCTAGSVDLGEGMFRHLVVTGRSRLALYLARIPAGLAIVRADGCDRVHHCLHCVRPCCSEADQLRRCQRARRPLAHRVRDLGRQPCRPSRLRSSVQAGPVYPGYRMSHADPTDWSSRGPGSQTAGQPTAAQMRAAAVQIAKVRTIRATPPSSCPRRTPS